MNKSTFLLTLLILFSSLLRLINLNRPSEFVFDENYTAFTGVSLAEKNRKEIWKPSVSPINPPRAYEWAHPPLARTLIAALSIISGNNAWVWRLPSVIAGTGSLLFLYLIAKSLFSNKVGLVAAYLLAFDGLSFAQSRIAMPDTLMLFFALTAIYLVIRKRFLLAGIYTGFSLSTKWLALPLVPLLVLAKLHASPKPKLRNLLPQLLIPLVVYIFAYTPMFFLSPNLYNWLNLQIKMAKHSLYPLETQTHPLHSPWWAWPTGMHATPYYLSPQSQVWNIPNPLIFWVGLGALLASTLTIIKSKTNAAKKAKLHPENKLSLLLIAYLIFLLPWILLYNPLLPQRSTYLYYYLPSLPFMHITSAYWLTQLLKNKGKPARTFALFILIFIPLLFLVFYPKLIGI